DDLTKAVIALNIVDDHRKAFKINTINDLKEDLAGICSTIFEALGRQRPEAAYQRALEIELKARTIDVASEVKAVITYKGEEVSSRRVDLFLNLPDGSSAIIELKAVQTVSGERTNCVHQLQYYMAVFGVEHGFVVNFPHDAGFPAPPEGQVFRQELVCGLTKPLSDVRLRVR
ncbi:unnamed protein product, partial [Laminaria digitata]